MVLVHLCEVEMLYAIRMYTFVGRRNSVFLTVNALTHDRLFSETPSIDEMMGDISVIVFTENGPGTDISTINLPKGMHSDLAISKRTVCCYFIYFTRTALVYRRNSTTMVNVLIRWHTITKTYHRVHTIEHCVKWTMQ
jgi:hypothetical protein